MQKITTCLTFKERGEEAIDFYVSVFEDAQIITKMSHEGMLLHGVFEIGGQRFIAMDGGDTFTFAEGTSLFVACETQDEVDTYWEKLTADGGAPGQCGWLKDKYGVSWQIIPNALGELMSDPDTAKSGRVMQAMLQMGKIDVAELERASRGE